MGIRKKVLFSCLTVVLLISTAYAALELTVRYMDLPDPEMIRDMRSEMEKADTPDTYLPSGSTPPVYGWDQHPIITPRNNESVMIDSADSILFVGDSLTRGFGLSNIEEEAYPSLLYQRLAQERLIRLINMSVQEFGVGQMILKLEEVLPLYQPILVVFAYIPQGLWRAGRNINYGWTKPVLVDFQSDTWAIIPAQNRWLYYRDFNDSEQGYYRGIWYLRHLFNNARYYFTDFHMDYYRNLFDAIRRPLMVLEKNIMYKFWWFGWPALGRGIRCLLLTVRPVLSLRKPHKAQIMGLLILKIVFEPKLIRQVLITSKRLNGTRTNPVTRCMPIVWKTHCAISLAGKSIKNSRECV